MSAATDNYVEQLTKERDVALRDYECMFNFYKAAESETKQLAGENNKLTEQLNAALEREQALAAKLALWNDWMNSLALYYDADIKAWEDKGWELRSDDHMAVLTKRDMIKQAEELDEVAAQIGILKPGQVSPVGIAVSLRMRSKDKRQQAAAL